ncbi:hypothetical protein T4A_6634 [Trichinella pseudospiralis]|uniref:CCHC-type domain-containing protein n=1 Tax=Trichinella pseudospiralis TaxID=6337 RepID=A0A0V1EJL1_TRIPS|nr:hypothetical protein T4A_6634 [Trichinella pseudospiralis]
MRVSSMKKKIETRRGIFKSQMEDLEHRLKENALQLELCAHSKEISNLYEQLDSLQTEFEEELEAEESEKERQTWKGLRMSLMDLRAQVESSMEVEEPTNSVNREVRQVHLPRYELEKFDGDVTRFREFWDQFEVSVHQQVDLSNATKLVYLRGCLTGVALDALQSLSAANQGLSALGKNPRDGSLSMGEVLIAVARERLPPSIRVQWDKQAMEDDSLAANLPVFLRFLQDQVELDDTVRGTKELRLESKRSTRAMGKLGNSGKGTETQRTMAFFHSAVELSCALCHEQHTIAECMKFRQASRQRNKEIAARFQICFSCFKPGHISIGCKSRRRRSGPSSKDNNSVTPVDTATAERVQEIPTAECKSSDVSMLQANLD